MSAKVLTVDAAKQAKLDVIENRKGTQAVHDVIVAMRANRRSGTACTKRKGEVAFSGAKPWRQKGTGRARAGYKSSPLWEGGGVAFGPKPRDYSKKTPKSVKRLAFRKALSSRIANGDVLTVEAFAVKEPKTKAFVSLFEEVAGDEAKTLIVSVAFDEQTYLAARNVKPTLLMTAAEVNTEHLLAFRKIVLVGDALQALVKRTKKND